MAAVLTGCACQKSTMKDAMTHEWNIDKIDGQDFGGAITLNLRSDDTISMPSFTELTGLSEAEFTVVMQRIMTNMESFSQMFG